MLSISSEWGKHVAAPVSSSRPPSHPPLFLSHNPNGKKISTCNRCCLTLIFFIFVLLLVISDHKISDLCIYIYTSAHTQTNTRFYRKRNNAMKMHIHICVWVHVWISVYFQILNMTTQILNIIKHILRVRHWNSSYDNSNNKGQAEMMICVTHPPTRPYHYPFIV